MDKWFHLTLYNRCIYLSTPGLKLIHVSKRGPCLPMPFLSLCATRTSAMSLRWPHNGQDGVSNHQPYHCLLNRLVRRRSKKTSKLRFTGLCVGNSPVTGELPAQMASNAANVSIWWRHHGYGKRWINWSLSSTEKDLTCHHNFPVPWEITDYCIALCRFCSVTETEM